MIERLLQRLAKVLTRHRVPYMLIGGQAVLFYGRPRMTEDVDITLGAGVEAFQKILQVCQDLGLKPLPEDPQGFVKKTHVLPAQDEASGFRIDFIFSDTPYERQAIKRTRRVRVGHGTVRIAALEDLLIHKLVAGRPIDLEDVRVLLAKHRDRIDYRYLRRWLKQFAELGTLTRNPLTTFETIRKSL